MLWHVPLVSGAILAFWLLLFLIGLPFTLACLPRHRRWLVAPLSPLVAMALVGCAYQYWFILLLQPYRPLVVHGALAIFSLAILAAAFALRREPVAAVLDDLLRGWKKVSPFMIVPIVGILVFSSFFAVNGLEMLAAGDDEFAYVETTRHFVQHMFTRSPLDVPWGRSDHYLADYSATFHPYWIGSRLGVNYLLADFSAVTGLSLERTFPLLMGVGAAIATASLAILMLFVRRSRNAVLAAQVAMAASWLLVMLHFQGSLSNMASLGLRLGGLAYICWAVAFSRKVAPLVLAGVLGAGWLVFYYESIGFGLVLPLAVSLAALVWRALRRCRRVPARFAWRAAAVIAAAFLLQPFLFTQAVNLHAGLASQNIKVQQTENVRAAVARVSRNAANVLPPILGYNSLYDASAVNIRVTTFLQPYGALTFLGLVGLAAIGFWRRLPPGLGEGWAVIPATLACIWIAGGLREDWFVFIRSAQTAMPLVFVGLSLLAFARRGAFDLKNRTLPSASIITFARVGTGMCWMAVVGLNGFTVARTIDHVNHFSQPTDTMTRHFDPEAPIWRRLREIVAGDDKAPVLVSGFTERPTPHMIALGGLRSIPHVVGQSITTFWKPAWSSAEPSESVPKEFSKFHHWLNEEGLVARLKADPISNWPRVYDDLVARSRRAIVPLHGPYPSEWGEWRSLLGARGWRFPNICDVLERDEPAYTIQAGAPRANETGGSGDRITLQPRLTEQVLAIVEVRYTGLDPRIMVDGSEARTPPRPGPGKTLIMAVDARVSGQSVITIQASPNTRLRSVGLYRLPVLTAGGQ